MAKLNKLSALAVTKVSKAGLYGDGAGLWLQVTKTGTKSWLFRYMRHGKAREMGLGATHTVSLSEAREKAHKCRVLLLEGKDPLDEKHEFLLQQRLESARSYTFTECAAKYIEAHSAGWSNAKHAWQWKRTLEMFVYPVIGDLPVSLVDTALVLKCVEPIWSQKPETASRVRQRIEAILDWAKAREFRTGENPARWRGHLDKLLPSRSKVAKVKHHPALPYLKVAAFMKALCTCEGVAAKALEFTIITGTRTGESLGAKWNEINKRERVWVIPAERMKMKKEHRVPLSTRAMEIIQQMEQIKMGEFVFPGARYDKPLSNTSMLMTMRRMGYSGLTTHGFRSTFRDWAAEMTAFPREVAEMALSHAVADKVEAAYRRGDLFLKRRKLMEDWATYCQKPAQDQAEKVVSIGAVNA